MTKRAKRYIPAIARTSAVISVIAQPVELITFHSEL
jgi:hypothetical protein